VIVGVDSYDLQLSYDAATGTIADNQWHFIVGTVDSAVSPQAKMYVDGVLAAQGNPSTNSVGAQVYPKNPNTMRIGGLGSSEGYRFSNVFLSSTALSAAEVASLFSNRVLPSSALSAWPLDEFSDGLTPVTRRDVAGAYPMNPVDVAAFSTPIGAISVDDHP